MTATVEEGQLTVFVAVDHCTPECVGLHAAKKATRIEALEPLRQEVRDYSGDSRVPLLRRCSSSERTGSASPISSVAFDKLV